MELPPRLSSFPAQKRIAERIVDALLQDDRVEGICLSGSFAYGEPDDYSDLDFCILVASADRDAVIRDHARLREQAGDMVADFPATHLGDPHQLITFYRADFPVHADYQYRTADELAPLSRDASVIILFDKSGMTPLAKS